MSEYLDKNGLKKGLIVAGTACPFLDRCKFKVHTCPGVDGNVKPNHFSCAAARLHSAIAESADAPDFRAKAKGIVEVRGEEPALFEIHKRPTYITFSSMKAVQDPKKENGK
jgi:hypothetical protein